MILPPQKQSHRKGEQDLDGQLSNKEVVSVDTYGGKVHVEWDPQAAVTPMGQMPFFTDFLKTSGVFDAWVEGCPLAYFSNNASKKRDILGTVLLSVLSGYTRYAHIASIRHDGVNPTMLGMSKVCSEDAVRRGIGRIEESSGASWLEQHLQTAYNPLLDIPWIMDIDTTIKPLYGHQEGALVGYNPSKPGRPSHTYHTYHIANIRMILDVEVEDGKSGAGCYSAPRLWDLLDRLKPEQRPAFIRGDSSYGTEFIMSEAERRGLGYLFKLRCTKKVKQLLAKMMTQADWHTVGQGWEGVESSLKLSGWQQLRRVVLLRKPLPKERLGVLKPDTGQMEMAFLFADVDTDVNAYEYQVLVTNLKDAVSVLAQHYRDRADCENNFDELKNQWGWGGYTTRDLKRNRLMAKITALVYNWWTVFTRLANPNSHLEAVTSRPLLLNAVAKQTKHAGQTKVTITSTHKESHRVSQILTRISQFFYRLRNSAEQLTSAERFFHILMAAFRKFIPQYRLQGLHLLPQPG